MRSREMGSRMYWMVHRAATADGADKSGLTALTWPVVANFAVDAAMAVALANTLFFAAAIRESKGKVALYLLITIAPFAVIAPLIGPALDRLQHGRACALATSFALRTALAIVLIMNYDGATDNYPSWVFYPCALAMMVFSKSFSVLRSAVTPTGDAADDRPGAGQLPADDVRSAGRHPRRRRCRGRRRVRLPTCSSCPARCSSSSWSRSRRLAVDADPALGRGDQGEVPATLTLSP